MFKEAELSGVKIEIIISILNKYLEKIADILKLDFDNSLKGIMNWDLNEILNKI